MTTSPNGSTRLLTLYCHECAKQRPFRFSSAWRDGDYAVHSYRCVICNGRHEMKIKLGAVPLKES